MFIQCKNHTFELDENQISEFILNSQIGVEKISKRYEIEYAAIAIKTKLAATISDVHGYTLCSE